MVTGLTRLGVAASIGMFLLLLSGSLVTNTGSADGCGNAWPFCDGDWESIATFIEVNHRLITGVLGIMILFLSVAAWRAYGKRSEIRFLVIASIFLLVLQSFLGAAAVVWGSPAPVMATHFGVSLASFGAVFLLTMRIIALSTKQDNHGGAPKGYEALAEGQHYRMFRRLLYVSLVMTLGVVYGGALVRHTNSGLACLDWPLCNGQLFPGFSGAVGLVFAHRLSVVALVLVVAYMGHQTRAFRELRPDLYKGSIWSLVLLIVQSLTGWLIVSTRAAVAANMLHAAVLILYTAVLLFLAIQVSPFGIRYRAAAPASNPEPVTDLN